MSLWQSMQLSFWCTELLKIFGSITGSLSAWQARQSWAVSLRAVLEASWAWAQAVASNKNRISNKSMRRFMDGIKVSYTQLNLDNLKVLNRIRSFNTG